MANLRQTLAIGGVIGCALTVASTAWQCDGGGVQGTNPDLSMHLVDLATPTAPPDLLPYTGPTITGVAPGAGSNLGGTSITISGTGFRAGATVSVGGAACTQVKVVADTTITCVTPAKAAYCAPAAVTVTNPDAQAATSSSGFTYQSKAFAFKPAANILNGTGAGTSSRSVVWADFDGDGKNDIANFNAANTNNVSVQLGKGDGTFKATVTTDLGANNPTAAMAVADLDNNGVPDLAIVIRAATTAPQLLAMLGQKDGTFKLQGAAINLTGSSSPTAVAVATADSKAMPYVVVAGTVGGKASLDVLQNDGKGNLSKLTAMAIGAAGSNASHLVLADINKDGKLDAIAVNKVLAGGVLVATGNGAGVFSPVAGSPFLMGVTPNHVAVADFNGDGSLDLATANTGNVAGTIGVALRAGDGKGGFGNSPTLITLPTAPTDLVTADFNGDGFLDLAMSQLTSGGGGGNVFTYLTGKAGFTFNAAATVAVNTQADTIVAAPFNTNSDTLPDVVTPSGNTSNLSIVLNQCQ